MIGLGLLLFSSSLGDGVSSDRSTVRCTTGVAAADADAAVVAAATEALAATGRLPADGVLVAAAALLLVGVLLLLAVGVDEPAFLLDGIRSAFYRPE